MQQDNRKNTWLTTALSCVLVLGGCTPAQYMPQFDEATLREKQREIAIQTGRVPSIIGEDPLTTLSRVYNRLAPHAKQLCIVNGEKWLDYSCGNWKLEVQENEIFNAFATRDRKIVFTTEVFKYTKSDDEIAFILAHEMAHHILNHLIEDAVNGELLGAATGVLTGVLMGALAAGLGANEETVNSIVKDAVADGYDAGRNTGRLAYSVDQESEADKFALELMNRVGYSHREARSIMLYIGSRSKDLRSVEGASHPSGPERLAAFDLYSRAYRSYTAVSVALPSKQKLTMENGDFYVGETLNGKPAGKGKYTWSHGAVYVGEFFNGKTSGQGKYTWSDGAVYVGEWVDGEMSGRGIENNVGVVRKGIWKENKYISVADVKLSEFDSYIVGDFKLAETSPPSSSKQKLTMENGDFYEGETLNGKPAGKGKYTWSHGAVYVGEFFNGKTSGQGKYTWSDGAVYVGEWVDGEMSGRGIENNVGVVRKGIWKENKYISVADVKLSEFDSYIVGDFKLAETSPPSSSKQKLTIKNGGVYVGETLNGKPSGRGEFKLPNGDMYVGEFFNGNISGQGKYTWSDGAVYVGEWVDGEMSGRGIEDYLGVVRKGIWKEHEFLSEADIKLSEFDPYIVGDFKITETSPPSSSSKQVLLSDVDIEGSVEAILRAVSTELKNANLVIISVNGVVLLAGQVPSEATKQKVTWASKDLSNVRTVYNALEISYPTTKAERANDKKITSKVERALSKNKRTKALKVKTITERGVVYLMGLVSRADSDAVVYEARQIYGVQKIVKLFEYTDMRTQNTKTDLPIVIRKVR